MYVVLSQYLVQNYLIYKDLVIKNNFTIKEENLNPIYSYKVKKITLDELVLNYPQKIQKIRFHFQYKYSETLIFNTRFENSFFFSLQRKQDKSGQHQHRARHQPREAHVEVTERKGEEPQRHEEDESDNVCIILFGRATRHSLLADLSLGGRCPISILIQKRV